MCKHSTKNNNSPHGTSGNHNHNHKHNIAIAIHAVILRKAISCPELLSLDALVLGLLAVTSYCYVVRLSKHENSKALTLNASDIGSCSCYCFQVNNPCCKFCQPVDGQSHCATGR